MLRDCTFPCIATMSTLFKDTILQGGACVSWALMAAIHRMDQGGLVLATEDATYINRCIKDSLLHWQKMRSACIQASVKRWSFRPKHHYWEHIGEQVERTRINPRKLACFQDESYLGQIKKIAVKCHSASALLRVFQRLSLNLGLRFEQSRASSRNPTPCPDKTQLVPSFL